MAIAAFYASGTLVGGVGAPALFGYLIGLDSRDDLFYGFLLGAADADRSLNRMETWSQSRKTVPREH